MVTKEMASNFCDTFNISPTNRVAQKADPKEGGMPFTKWWTVMYTVCRKPAWRSKLQQTGFEGNVDSLESKEEIWEAL
eukprot:2424734-Karenia_brevis.AAC.1